MIALLSRISLHHPQLLPINQRQHHRLARSLVRADADDRPIGGWGGPSSGNRDAPSLTGGASDPRTRRPRPEPDDFGCGRDERQTRTNARAGQPTSASNTPRNAELSLATSMKPTRRSRLRMVTASGVAGEGCRWRPDAEVQAVSCHITMPRILCPVGTVPHPVDRPRLGGGPFTKEIAS
jgi:hypothetical protein